MDAHELFDGGAADRLSRYPDLHGKRVFITGGGSGIGAYFSAAFALQGAEVGFVSLNEEIANALNSRIEQQCGRRLFYRSCDIRDVAALQSVMAEFAAEHGHIQVLVNNAARDDRVCLQDLNLESWDAAVNVNLRPYLFAMQSVVPAMAQHGGGSVINISSNAPQLGVAGFPAYVATKAAISGMSKALAQEVGAKGVRVNAILPGWCLTERQRRLWMSDEGVQKTLERQAIKRMLTGVDLANAALFLAAEASAMISGVSLNVDGGIA